MCIVPAISPTAQWRRLASLALTNALALHQLARTGSGDLSRRLYALEAADAKRAIQFFRSRFVLPVQAVGR